MSSHSSGKNQWIWLPAFMIGLLRGIFALFMEPGTEKIKYSARPCISGKVLPFIGNPKNASFFIFLFFFISTPQVFTPKV